MRRKGLAHAYSKALQAQGEASSMITLVATDIDSGDIEAVLASSLSPLLPPRNGKTP